MIKIFDMVGADRERNILKIVKIAQDHLVSEIYKEYTVRYVYVTKNWVEDSTPLEIIPPSDKNLLVTRIGFATYDPAADFTQTVKIEFYDGSEWIIMLEEAGYAPLMIGSSRVDSFKIGDADVIHISTMHRNSISLRSTKEEKLKFSVSDPITGADKFFAGCTAIEFK